MSSPQGRMYYYEAYAQRLASWGFAVAQYDVPMFSIVKDGTEVSARLSAHALACKARDTRPCT